MADFMFPLGRIVPPSDVVDRTSFIEKMKITLADGNSVMISGPRRTGKSTVAEEVLRQLRESGQYTASVDLFRITTVEELAVKLLQSILENRTGILTRHVSSIIQFGKEIMQAADIHAKFRDLEIGLSLSTKNNPSPIDMLETALITAERLAEKDGKRMVILLDEFQELSKIGDTDLLKRLRSIFQRQQYTSYFFLGSESSMLDTIFADRRQAFYRFAMMVRLPDIPETEWMSYIKHKLGKAQMKMTDRALEMLLAKTGGHPYCVMSIMNNAYLDAKVSNIDEIDSELLLSAYEQSLAQLNSTYEEQWKEIRETKGSGAALVSMLKNNPIFTKEHPNALRAVNWLIRLSIIRKGSGRGKYELLEPMFGDWLLREK